MNTATFNGHKYVLRQPKQVAKIVLCNALTFTIDDTMTFTMPTEEQRKNLKELFCIDVIPIDEELQDLKETI